MQVRTRHMPTFGVARLVLGPGEAMQAGAGTMVSTSYGVDVRRAQSTVFRQLAKIWRDALVFTASGEGGWVDVAPSLPGDLYGVELDGTQGWCVGKTSWLAAAGTIALESSWSGLRAMFGGDTGFLAHATGVGPLVLSCCGALDVINLAPGELITIDPGHLVAFPDTVAARLRAISQTGAQSIRTGEGLALDFAGPGQVIIQTRSPRTMAELLATYQPDGRN